MSFPDELLKWYRHNARQLPWRDTGDPYKIWLSEIILQQTRIAQGTDYYLRFINRWPTVEALARATEDEVLRMWQGLGYYSRARNLLAAAREVAKLGQFPADVAELRKLPGVGPYTAAAIASFAFNLPHAVVDGNVFRVLARHFNISTPINTSQGQRLFTTLANQLLPPRHAAAYNQAIMDFGAMVCTPAAPKCDICPMAMTCQALADHNVEQRPVKQPPAQKQTRHISYLLIICHNHTAIRRRPAGDIWQGLWEPPMYENEPVPGFDGQLIPLRQNVRHVLTHRIIIADFHLLVTDRRPDLPGEYIWVPLDRIDDYGHSRLVELLLQSARLALP